MTEDRLDDGSNDRCIGSACMMWHWQPADDNLRQWINDDGELCVCVSKTPQGYCGLAGKPG